MVVVLRPDGAEVGMVSPSLRVVGELESIVYWLDFVVVAVRGDRCVLDAFMGGPSVLVLVIGESASEPLSFGVFWPVVRRRLSTLALLLRL